MKQTHSVRCGADRLAEFPQLFSGRLGLITGASGVTADGRFTIDVLREQYDLRVLLAPEHGIRGVLGPGETVHTHVDALSGLPAYSMFEDQIFSQDVKEKDRVYLPPAGALAQLDTLVFDLQDVGSRYYTYASTLFYAMRAAAATGKKLVVLDRPNPIGGTLVEGNTHTEELFSFVGLTPVPIRHGMTLGELALYYNGEHGLGCELAVIPVENWRRDMYYDETGLPFTPPSPNLPTQESVVVYNGTCLLEGTTVSCGRGTTTPFTLIGAPFVQPVLLAETMNALALPGVQFAPAYFRPEWGKHAHLSCGGVRIHVTDEKAVRPVALGVHLICTLRRLFPEGFACNPPAEGDRWHIDLTSGNSDLREGLLTAPEILAKWEKEAEAFLPIRQKYLLYNK